MAGKRTGSEWGECLPAPVMISKESDLEAKKNSSANVSPWMQTETETIQKEEEA